MSTAKRTFASQSQCVGSGDSYVTLSGTTESFGSNIDLETDGYEGVQVEVEVKWDAGPTDDVIVSVYAKLGSSYDGEEIAIFSQRMTRLDNDSTFLAIILRDILHCRVGVVQTGSTDSHDVRAYQKRWRWDIS